jgi:hypothetical protein
MDSDKIKQMCLRLEEVFQNTVAAFNTATTANNNVFPSRKTEL